MVIQRIKMSANTEFLCNIIFVTSFSNSHIIIMMLPDLHKFTKIVTKFWIRIKRMDRSHKCAAETNQACNRLVNKIQVPTFPQR